MSLSSANSSNSAIIRALGKEQDWHLLQGTPPAWTIFTASSLNSRLNFLLVSVKNLQFHFTP
jgi:hypothetical protein